ncbi:MAG: hypothetical protein AAGD34_12120 [Pseudomonadota bacterium]
MLGPLPDTAPAFFADIAGLKRVRSARAHGQSLADGAFLTAWSRLAGGEDPESVAGGVVAFAAAHTVLGAVDGPTLSDAGVGDADRQMIYREAAGRSLGSLARYLEAPIQALAASEPFLTDAPPFAQLLTDQPCLSEDHGDPPPSLAAHSWCVAAIAGTIELARNAPLAPAVMVALVHHAGNAFVPDGGPGATRLLTAHVGALGERMTERALSQCPPQIASMGRDGLEGLSDLSTTASTAFHAAHIIERTADRRHAANRAGFSLSDAFTPHDLVDDGPLAAFQREVLHQLGLGF